MTNRLVGIALGSVLLVVVLTAYVHTYNVDISRGVQDMGYNVDDVKTFCKYTDYRLEDFIDSEGVRTQYKSWKEGKIKFLKKENLEGTTILIECDMKKEKEVNEDNESS